MSRAVGKICKWLKSKGYTAEPGMTYACYWEEKRVTYRKGDSEQTQIRGLLHECGHVLCARGSTTRFKAGYPAPVGGHSRSRISKADILHEELEAWHRGYRLAKTLEIRVDSKAYWHDYGVCIRIKCKKLLAGEM